MWLQPLLWLWVQSNALNVDSDGRVKHNNNFSLITQSWQLRPVGSYRLVVMWLELCTCHIFGQTKGGKQLLFSCFVLSCLYFLSSSPLYLSLFRIVISLFLSQERLRPTFIHSFSASAAPSTTDYRTGRLQSPWYPVAAAVLRTVIKEAPRISNIITLFKHSRLIISWYIVRISKNTHLQLRHNSIYFDSCCRLSYELPSSL